MIDAGERTLAIAYVNDFWDPEATDPKRRDRNLVVESVQVVLTNPATSPPRSHLQLISRRPAAGESHLAVATELLAPFATRAFRRPVEPAEVERLAKLVVLAEEQGDSFEVGMQLAMNAVLVSPYFLFRVEADPGPAGTAAESDSSDTPQEEPASRPLNDWELATRLSYFLWATMPDEELFAEAKRGTLHEPAALEAQVRRMLADSKSQTLVKNFGAQWLQTCNLNRLRPSNRGNENPIEGFPALRVAMRRETEMFFSNIIKNDRSILEFIDADYTFLNERLAEHYGIADVKGDDFRQVQLKGDQRGGVLTQAAVLAITSNPTRTSPVKRGKWVMETLLGAAPPAAPPGVPKLDEKEHAVESASLRQRLEVHRAKAECAVCHDRMDPLGFGLENFDYVGRWRTTDGKFEIDASGVLPGGETFNGVRGLKDYLKKHSADFTHCLSEKLLTYALGRGVEYYDRQAVDRIADTTTKADHKFSALVLAVVMSEPFQRRSTQGFEP
jgi:hypothetical protein